MSCTCSVVRVVGPDLATIDQFRSAVLQHFASSAPSLPQLPTEQVKNTSDLNTQSKTDSANNASLTLSNRYFTAVVGLHGLLEEVPMTADFAADAEMRCKEDGIILVTSVSSTRGKSVVDGSNMNSQEIGSFDALAALHETADRQGKAGDLLRLCVAISSSSSVSSSNELSSSVSDADTDSDEAEYSRRILWCLDRGYEYVENVDLSPEGVTRGHDERDKNGFARVIEAMSTTVWSSAVLHKNQQTQLKNSYAEVKKHQQSASSSAAVSQETNKDEVAAEEENAYVPPDPGLLSTTVSPEVALSDQEREERARQALLLLEEEEEKNNGNSHQAALNNDPSTSSAAAAEDECRQEVYFDNFESALREAGRLREMSRSGTMSDEDRRKRAGDAAVLIMNLMNQMGGCEEEEEEESDTAEELEQDGGDNNKGQDEEPKTGNE